jgi:hypothetical protein
MEITGSSLKEGVCMFQKKNIHKNFKARWLLEGGRLREKCIDPALEKENR